MLRFILFFFIIFILSSCFTLKKNQGKYHHPAKGKLFDRVLFEGDILGSNNKITVMSLICDSCGYCKVRDYKGDLKITSLPVDTTIILPKQKVEEMKHYFDSLRVK